MIKLNAKELRASDFNPEDLRDIKRNPITIVVDNVYDSYNIGSIFRLADAVAAEKVILCGISDCPPNIKIKRASINTTEVVPWEYYHHTSEAIRTLINQGYYTIAIEQTIDSRPFQEVDYPKPVALVVGNETTGVSEDVLNMVAKVVEIPMFGFNQSLNVHVSLSLVLYEVMRNEV